jgi:hypothetical protein
MEAIASICALTGQVTPRLQQLAIVLNSTQELSALRAGVQDASEKFRLWAGNIGAYHATTKKTSMEYRLRAAPQLRQEVCTLLCELNEALEDCEPNNNPKFQTVLKLVVSAAVKQPEARRVKEAIIVQAHPETLAIRHCDTDDCLDESQELLDIVLDCIRGLLRLSVLIRKATPRDRYEKALQKSSLQFSDEFDIRHVGEKFPKLHQKSFAWLKVRLGRAITDRRRFLAYCRDHHEQLDQEPNDASGTRWATKTPRNENDSRDASSARVVDVAGHSTVIGTVKASTQASTLQLKAFHERGELCDIDDALSYTTVGSDLLCDDDHEAALELPSLESIRQEDKHFACPFCQVIQDYTTEKQWR